MASRNRGQETQEDRESAFSALASRFQADEFTETVYRASLFAKGLRGDAINTRVREQLEIKHGRKIRGNR